jgi:hypothetical protein
MVKKYNSILAAWQLGRGQWPYLPQYLKKDSEAALFVWYIKPFDLSQLVKPYTF